MKKGNIILLNGVSSAGKTTLTKAIQSRLDVPYYHICCDDFMSMSPKHILDKQFSKQLDVTQSMMQDVVKLYSDRGHHVIVDDVILDDNVPDLPEKNEWFRLYLEKFNDYPILFVNVICPLEELERRERERGDRAIGQSKFQLERMDTDVIYDMKVDTYNEGIERGAERIIKMLGHRNKWIGFKSNYNAMKHVNN